MSIAFIVTTESPNSALFFGSIVVGLAAVIAGVIVTRDARQPPARRRKLQLLAVGALLVCIAAGVASMTVFVERRVTEHGSVASGVGSL